MIKQLILVFIGGGLGSVLRLLFSLWINSENFKWMPTLSVNILGCFLLGLFLAYSDKEFMNSSSYILLGVGFCGGLTTFSTFSLDLFKLTSSSEYGNAMLYISLTIILGYAAVYGGYHLIKQ
ncbi:fluoride efflux transporter CrcB [Nonlabens sp.]|uniref:fluoride efflux transporter CrcB n=1 Tax=Nonlabens sp. TaxID=1888209 RepID=UPI003F6A5265